MNRHPGGTEKMTELLALVPETKGKRLLDLGAGDGETVRLLRDRGILAQGIDLSPRSPEVAAGDFLSTGQLPETWDICISECAFFVSGNQPAAIKEAYRILKKSGYLILTDLDPGNLEEEMKKAGFAVVFREDMTEVWREYYFWALWNDAFCCEEYKLLAKAQKGKHIGYTALIGRKE